MADHEVPTGQDVVDSVIELIRSVPDPLGQIALIDHISREMIPAVYEEGGRIAAAYREAGGTWVEIGKQLSITPAGAQMRLDPVHRQRNVERNRQRRAAAKGDAPSDEEEA